MLLKRFYDESLAQASYMIGCEACGEAIIVDPNRDVDAYIEAAAREKMRIVAVTETHIHADFVSGTRELAARTGATPMLSAEGGPDWSYGFAADAGARLLRDGDVIRLGRVELQVMHTPGHTPEHIAFVITDTAASDRPMAMLSGDFVFVGDVGRPDLLEKAAGVAGTMEAGARQLWSSLQRVRDLPDYLQLWPGHGAGSACGKALGSLPSTTLGYERLYNWAFQAPDENAFLAEVLAGQPEPPAYFAAMKRINRDGPPMRSAAALPPEIDLAALDAALARGAWVVDTRGSLAFAAAHIPGTVCLPISKSFATYAGTVIPFDAEVILIAGGEDAEQRVREGRRLLSLIGYDVAAWAGDPLWREFAEAGRRTESLEQVRVHDIALHPHRRIVDVRNSSEWRSGHIPGAMHHFLGVLLERTHELPRETPLLAQCAGGTRSVIAASLLRARGFTDVANLVGGFDEWQRAGHPIHTEHPEGSHA